MCCLWTLLITLLCTHNLFLTCMCSGLLKFKFVLCAFPNVCFWEFITSQSWASLNRIGKILHGDLLWIYKYRIMTRLSSFTYTFMKENLLKLNFFQIANEQNLFLINGFWEKNAYLLTQSWRIPLNFWIAKICKGKRP